MLLYLLFFYLFPIIFAMSPYDDILLTETPSVVNMKYTVDKEEFNVASYSFDDTSHLKVTRTVALLDADNFELQYDFTAQDKPVSLNHIEIEIDVNLADQVMMAEGFQCWSTTKELDRYSTLSAIPGVVSWFTQFNLQG